MEYEKKLLLDQEKFNNIVELYCKKYKSNKYIQVNYYYDTKDFEMHNKNITIRVRQKKDSLRLETKYHKADMGNICISDEKSKSIIELPQKIIVDGKELLLLGSLITYRIDIEINNSIVSLDENYYLGKVDYELEIEYISDDFLLDEIDEGITTPIKGKYTRFIDALKEYNCL